MSVITEVEELVVKLSDSERARLTEKLIASLDESDQLRKVEVEPRIDEVESGTASMSSGDVVRT